jgi:hypothetical protein
MKVFYHANCNDGYMAAYIWWLRTGESAEPVSYSDPDPYESTDDLRTFLDFCPKEPRPSDTIFDHHPIAKGLPHFDPDECGCSIVAKWFEAEYWFVPYVRDRDLWLKKLPLTDTIAKGIGHYVGKPFAMFHNFCFEKNILQIGTTIRDYENKYVEQAAKRAWKERIYLDDEGYDVTMVNNTNYSAGSDLAHKLGGTVIMFSDSNYSYNYSIRGPHARTIAQYLGGNGHEEAAGASNTFWIGS